MTQIPEVGSVWSQEGQNRCIIVYADGSSVLAELESNHARFMFSSEKFMDCFHPEPSKATHRRWINLYADGRVGDFHETERAALEVAERLSNEGYVETRLIEWTVEE